MIDQHKMYSYINWFIFSVYVSLTIIICSMNNIEINEYGVIVIKDIWKYILNCFPLIISYPFLHFVNEHYYESGAYRKFIRRRIKNVSI